MSWSSPSSYKAAIRRSLDSPAVEETPIPYTELPTWRVLLTLVNDSIQHTGQINYIRGLVPEPNWRRRAEDAGQRRHQH